MAEGHRDRRTARRAAGEWADTDEEQRANKQQGDPNALERDGDPRGGLQSDEYRRADPRELVEEDGIVMSGPGGAPQEANPPTSAASGTAPADLCDTRPMEGLQVGGDGVTRCWWAGDEPLMCAYHDDEWGRPERRPERLFELLTLESFQSGLSWSTILRKREGFRRAFDGFDAARVAGHDEASVARLLADASIVRHRGKIESAIANARAIQALDVPLAELLWSFAPPRGPRPRGSEDVPAQTEESAALSRELKLRGFRFLGPTTVYAFMQAAGLVDDHVDGCAVPASG